MVAKVVDEPVCTDAVRVETPIKVKLAAVAIAVSVMGVSTHFVIYPIVETRSRVKM